MSEKEISEKMQDIMKRMKNRREELNMSYQTLSEKVGISKSTLQRYETGYIKNMPVDKLEEIANALNVSPAYLMGWGSTPDEKTREIMNHSKEFDFPLNIRSAARDLMDLSDSDQELAINMIHSLAKKGRKANED